MSLKRFTSGERLLASDLNSMVTQIEANIPMVEITWSALKTLRDNSQLVPGTTYRITDYNCTTSQYNTSSAGHQFDILVVADDVNKLNENVHAIQHSGDTYFSSCNLSAWELKYCLDNDDRHFAWAVTGSTGRGVIYYMKDEWNNECPYDFKNILYTSSYPTQYTNMYTFCSDDATKDLSMNGYTNGVYNNSMLSYVSREKQEFNFNVFIGSNNNSNVLLNNCHNNTFGNNCHNNTFGNNCNNITFGNKGQYNAFGNSCRYNKFGNGCHNNNLGNDCNNIILGNDCYYNIFGNSCYAITFGNKCASNTFGISSGSNTFGNECQYNTFGELCQSNTFTNYFQYNTCGECVKNINFTNYYTTADNSKLRYLHILNGYAYNSSTAVPTGIAINAEFPQFIGYNSSKVFTVKKPLD